jgi:hypothetical protein
MKLTGLQSLIVRQSPWGSAPPVPPLLLLDVVLLLDVLGPVLEVVPPLLDVLTVAPLAVRPPEPLEVVPVADATPPPDPQPSPASAPIAINELQRNQVRVDMPLAQASHMPIGFCYVLRGSARLHGVRRSHVGTGRHMIRNASLAILCIACCKPSASAEVPTVVVAAPPPVANADAGAPDPGTASTDKATPPVQEEASAPKRWWCAEANVPTCKSFCVRGESACQDAIRHADGEPCFPSGLGQCFEAEQAWCTSWRVVGWEPVQVDCSPRRAVCESVRRVYLKPRRPGESVIRDVGKCIATP